MKKIGICELKKCAVYLEGHSEKYGIVEEVLFGKVGGKIEKIIIATNSIVPLRQIIGFCDILKIEKNRIVVKTQPTFLEKSENCRKFRVLPSSLNNCGIVFLRDIRFDTESGEITDVYVSKHKYGGKRKIPINKIFVKDNTVYIE